MADPLNTPTMLLARGLRLSPGESQTTPSGKALKGLSRRRSLLSCISEDENTMQPMKSPSKFAIAKQLKHIRQPLEEHDPNSQDSGIFPDDTTSSKSDFRFAAPLGTAPKRFNSDLNCMDVSPSHSMSPHSQSPTIKMVSPRRWTKSPRRALFSQISTDSAVSMDDDAFLEVFPPTDENAQCPSLGNLLSARILDSTPPKSPNSPSSHQSRQFHTSQYPSKRSLSLVMEHQISGDYRKSPSKLCHDDVDTPLSKRPRPLSTLTDNAQRGTLFQYGFKTLPSPPVSTTPSPPKHCIEDSPNGENKSQASSLSPDIKLKLQRSTQEELIGDMSRPFALPLVSCKHNDLKAIAPSTLASLIKGHYSNEVSSYRIIDCRYPYEFVAGHIKGAENLFTRDQISQCLISFAGSIDKNFSQTMPEGNKNSRHVLVFHCEFSSERGPCLYRWLRKEDRSLNPYPSLHFPEIYLLDGGYKEFFTNFSELCEPRSYKPMAHPLHSEDLRHFRNKSKSWAGNNHKKITSRNLSRLNL